jgi:hypothetical protein
MARLTAEVLDGDAQRLDTDTDAHSRVALSQRSP